MFKIKNVRGTAARTCPCGSWLSHWEKFSGQTSAFCQVEECLETDVVGAHVQVAVGDGEVYIYPLCKLHNQSSGVLLVSDTYKLVSANKALTCERPRRR